jgi:hypothetical protein
VPQRFRVALKYREPTYEMGAGRKPEPFNGGSVEIVAEDAVEALRLVLRRFAGAQRLSKCELGEGGRAHRNRRAHADGVTVPVSLAA